MVASLRALAACAVYRRMLRAAGTAPSSYGWTAGSSSVRPRPRSRVLPRDEVGRLVGGQQLARRRPRRAPRGRRRRAAGPGRASRAAPRRPPSSPRRCGPRAGPASRGRAAAPARRAPAASAGRTNPAASSSRRRWPDESATGSDLAWSVSPNSREQLGDDLLGTRHPVPAGRQVQVLGDRQRREVRVVVEDAGHLRAERDVPLVDLRRRTPAASRPTARAGR